MADFDSTSHATGGSGWASHVASEQRTADDFYPTPAPATRCLLRHAVFVGPIWECASGRGDISRVLEAHGLETVNTDLRALDFGFGSALNFLEAREALAPNLVTNPPYGLFREFLEHSFGLPGLLRSAWHVPYPVIANVWMDRIFQRYGAPELIITMVPPFDTERADGTVKAGFFRHCWMIWDLTTRRAESRFVLADWRRGETGQNSLFQS